jgi:hypothetical protein
MKDTIFVICLSLAGLGFLIVVLDATLKPAAIQTGTNVVVVTGEYEGMPGRVVSTPWIGNFWHSSMEINVAVADRREWVTLGHGDVRLAVEGEDEIIK